MSQNPREALFYGPRLKVERADHHIANLKTAFRSYIKANLKRLMPKRYNDSGQSRPTATLSHHIPTVMGDAIHNLRAALDHAYCELVLRADGGIDRWTTFPFHKDKVSLEASLRGHKQAGKAPSDSVIHTIINSIQPFEGGGDNLYGLHQLDITDKHSVLVPTAISFHISRLDIIGPDGKPTGGGFSNISLLRPKAHQVSGDWFGFADGMGAKLYGNPNNAFSIAFDEGQPFAGEGVIETLSKLRAAVWETLNELEAAAHRDEP